MRRFFLCVGILTAFIFGGTAFAGTGGTGGSERTSRSGATSAGKVPTFTLEQAILAAFQRDSAYFAFRNILDSLIATVKTQFYQIIVNRELVSVNEENVHLLEAQLKDQQNRFEAGTVPRFNVLQADVQLHNQIPQLITAQNNLRISKLQLAKTLGLDFQRRRGESAPLVVVGQLTYIPRR